MSGWAATPKQTVTAGHVAHVNSLAMEMHDPKKNVDMEMLVVSACMERRVF